MRRTAETNQDYDAHGFHLTIGGSGTTSRPESEAWCRGRAGAIIAAHGPPSPAILHDDPSEELHFGRAATRLYITSRRWAGAIRELEAEPRLRTAAPLIDRRGPSPRRRALPRGRDLLVQADRVRASRSHQRGADTTITIGTLAEQAGTRLAAAYRAAHPDVQVHIREGDFADPTAGLRAGRVDIALTRHTGITTQVLRTDPVTVSTARR